MNAIDEIIDAARQAAPALPPTDILARVSVHIPWYRRLPLLKADAHGLGRKIQGEHSPGVVI